MTVLEIKGLGPGPFGVMLLADMGAEVICVEKPPSKALDKEKPRAMLRGRRSICLDLKHPDGREVLARLIARSDVLVEGFRPGVMERLGAGPDDALSLNPRLVFARVTGWGQGGPHSMKAGHDINYIAGAGILDLIGRENAAPSPPLNFLGDFAGGGMMLSLVVLC